MNWVHIYQTCFVSYSFPSWESWGYAIQQIINIIKKTSKKIYVRQLGEVLAEGCIRNDVKNRKITRISFYVFYE